MTEISTIDWFGRLATSVFSENTATLSFDFEYLRLSFACILKLTLMTFK